MKAALFLFSILLIGCARETIILQETPTQQTYGEIYYHNDAGATLSIPDPDKYVNLTLMTSCSGVGFTCDNYTLIPQVSGTYSTEFHISFGGGANSEYHATIGINGVETLNCHGARFIGTGGDVGNMGGTCQIYLTAGEVITLMVENEGNNKDITVQDSNFNMVLI